MNDSQQCSPRIRHGGNKCSFLMRSTVRDITTAGLAFSNRLALIGATVFFLLVVFVVRRQVKIFNTHMTARAESKDSLGGRREAGWHANQNIRRRQLARLLSANAASPMNKDGLARLRGQLRTETESSPPPVEMPIASKNIDPEIAAVTGSATFFPLAQNDPLHVHGPLRKNTIPTHVHVLKNRQREGEAPLRPLCRGTTSEVVLFVLLENLPCWPDGLLEVRACALPDDQRN